MKQTNKTIKLRITRIAARTCGWYFDRKRCVAAIAIQRQFKLEQSEVTVFGFCAIISGKHFQFSKADANKLHRVYCRPYYNVVRHDFVPFTIDLIPVC